MMSERFDSGEQDASDRGLMSFSCAISTKETQDLTGGVGDLCGCGGAVSVVGGGGWAGGSSRGPGLRGASMGRGGWAGWSFRSPGLRGASVGRGLILGACKSL